MRLMLLRHAKAERSQPGQRDRERSLTERGRRDAQQIGAYMARHDLVPDAAVVSPAARTCETWELVLKAFDRTPGVSFDDRLYDATPGDILDVIKHTGPKVGALLVVGHNPGLHELAIELIGSGDREGRERLGEGLPTAGLAAIDFRFKSWARLGPHTGRLERFVTPRLLTPETE